MSQINIHSQVTKEHHGGIHIASSEKGSLHRAMGVPQGQKLSVSAERGKLAKAKASGNVSLEKKLVFSLNARHFSH